MPTDWTAERKRGAFAIESEIDRQLEASGYPRLNRTWLCDRTGFDFGVEYIYVTSTGRKVTVKFSAHELKWFRRASLPETVAKIRDAVSQVVNEPGQAGRDATVAQGRTLAGHETLPGVITSSS